MGQLQLHGSKQWRNGLLYHTSEVQKGLDTEADRAAKKASMIHKKFRDRGHSRIVVEDLTDGQYGDDRYITMDDSRGAGAAWAIEMVSKALRRATGLV